MSLSHLGGATWGLVLYILHTAPALELCGQASGPFPASLTNYNNTNIVIFNYFIFHSFQREECVRKGKWKNLHVLVIEMIEKKNQLLVINYNSAKLAYTPTPNPLKKKIKR